MRVRGDEAAKGRQPESETAGDTDEGSYQTEKSQNRTNPGQSQWQ